MSLRELSLKKTYSSDSDDILYDFYIPALQESIEYNRLAGFFSSASLALTARGILGLIKNNGMIKLLVSPKLSKEDVETIIKSKNAPEEYIEKKMINELEKLEDEFVRDHVFALGWMIANKKLEIKVAIPYHEEKRFLSYEEIQREGIFHQKVGILKDSTGNIITFSGSINESVRGWLGNIEELKVFRSWEPAEEDYLSDDISKFNRFWNNHSKHVKVFNIPDAVKKKLVEIAPVDIEKVKLEQLYKKTKKQRIVLYQYQKDAINSWAKNKMRGIFEMATGTGKTFTALGCLERISKNLQKLLVIISSPYQHLVDQWRGEIEKYGIEYDDLIIASSSNPLWKNKLADLLIDIYLGYINKIIILTTHDTFSSSDFKKIILNEKSDFPILLIADEVHGLGAEKRKDGLINKYNLRLGLSATPKRWFDDVGTNAIYEYFGGVVYEFSLKEAIINENPDSGESYLTPYRYLPQFVSLTFEELEEYINKSIAIAMQLNKIKDDLEKNSYLENLLFARANIIKNAIEKYNALEKILNNLGPSLKWTIIYCSAKQIDEIMKIINERKINAHRFTMNEGTTPDNKYNDLSEREFILQKFAEGKYQVLVAMKCLDEGVDVPPARSSILMANSGNPREYIQRIGRVIRRYKGKDEATIYDIIVIPSFNDLPPELREIEWSIFKKELNRYEEIAKIAVNNAEASKLIFNIKNRILAGRR